MTIAADGIHIEEVRKTEFAETNFQPFLRFLCIERQEITV